MALATGADTHKMKYGHRGGNHPVKDLATGRVYISSQNHGYVVDTDTLDPNVAVPAFVNVKMCIRDRYKRLLELDEVKLEFDDDALRSIARKALEKDTGARALRSIIEDFMLDIMYEIPKDSSIGEVIITKDYIEKTGGPTILLRGQEVPKLEQK